MFIQNTKTLRTNARSLRYGVGINDAPYSIQSLDSQGKKVICPFYQTWVGMLRRCYCKSFLASSPTYMGCSVDPSWFVFSNFRSWMSLQLWEGKVLDKDLKVQGNREYGPNTCLFIDAALNALLCLTNKRRGKYPLGVCVRVRNGNPYIAAQCSFYGKQVFLGHYPTVEEAALAYKKAKLTYIAELANNETDINIKDALLRLF